MCKHFKNNKMFKLKHKNQKKLKKKIYIYKLKQFMMIFKKKIPHLKNRYLLLKVSIKFY